MYKIITLLLLLFFIWGVGVIPASVLAQTEDEEVENILIKMEQAYLSCENGKIMYEHDLSHFNRQDTAYTQNILYFSKNSTKKSQCKVRLNFFYVNENKQDTLYIEVFIRGKKSYQYTDRYKRFSSVSTKRLLRVTTSPIKQLPALYTKQFFKRLHKKKTKKLSDTESHYLVSTPYTTYYINKQNYWLDSIITKAQSDSLVYYETVKISTQQYNKSNFEKTHLYEFEDYRKQAEALPKATPKPLKNQKAPVWKGFDVMSRDTFSLVDFENQVVVLDFWNTGCGPCIKFFPKLKELQQEFASKNVAFVGMVNNQYPDFIIKFLERRNETLTYPNVLINDDIAKSYQVESYPTFIILNQKLEVIYKSSGTHRAKKKLKRHIQKALKD
ncbi:MAG: TlpA family protein disulfide reductase [Bernardetiaceae bacterium]|nr:TlpA family protein disulfide reductase [Bernardetiaceae bacterium]